jgi:hypothetical protein
MNISLTLTEEQSKSLDYVTSGFNSEKSGSYQGTGSYTNVTSEEYLSDRVYDLIGRYVESYNVSLKNDATNLKLYSETIQYKDDPAVAAALQSLIDAVESAKES